MAELCFFFLIINSALSLSQNLQIWCCINTMVFAAVKDTWEQRDCVCKAK